MHSACNLTKSSSKLYGNYKLYAFITKNLIKKTPDRQRERDNREREGEKESEEDIAWAR